MLINPLRHQVMLILLLLHPSPLCELLFPNTPPDTPLHAPSLTHSHPCNTPSDRPPTQLRPLINTHLHTLCLIHLSLNLCLLKLLQIHHHLLPHISSYNQEGIILIIGSGSVHWIIIPKHSMEGVPH